MNIDFYILDDAGSQQSLFFACQLIEKAYAEQKRIYIHAKSRDEAERLDALLWTYADDSFLPHQLYKPADACPPPIQIGYGQGPEGLQDVMLNLCTDIPAFYKQFKQVIEIVFPNPLVQQLARERYRQYRGEGCQVNTHKLKTQNE